MPVMLPARVPVSTNFKRNREECVASAMSARKPTPMRNTDAEINTPIPMASRTMRLKDHSGFKSLTSRSMSWPVVIVFELNQMAEGLYRPRFTEGFRDRIE
jgi:hypothetical protein